MSMEDNARQVCSFVMPICLFLTPIALTVEIYAFFNDPKASEVSTGDLIFLNVMIFGGFFMSLWYCKTQMGWFRKKN